MYCTKNSSEDSERRKECLPSACPKAFNLSPSKKTPTYLQWQNKQVRVRRPFKYIKHLGPRPTPSSTRVLKPQSHSRPEVRSPSEEQSMTSQRLSLSGSPSASNCSYPIKAFEKPFALPTSRLLRSRNLNLSAIDTSACTSKRLDVVVLRDEFDHIIGSGNTRSSARPSTSRISQARMSHFSDFSNPPTESRRLSYSLLASARTSHYIPVSSPEEIHSSNFPSEPHPFPKRRSEVCEFAQSSSRPHLQRRKVSGTSPFGENHDNFKNLLLA